MCEKGMLTGNKIAGVQFTLLDGQHHEVDSSDYCESIYAGFPLFRTVCVSDFTFLQFLWHFFLAAFFLAAQGAIRDCFEQGSWRIIEPIMLVEILAPFEFMNTVLGGVTKRGGILASREITGDWFSAEAEVPLNKMFGYASELR